MLNTSRLFVSLLLLALLAVNVVAGQGVCDKVCCMNCERHYSMCCTGPNGYYCSASDCNEGDLVMRFPKPSNPKPKAKVVDWAHLTAISLSQLSTSDLAAATAQDIALIPATACVGFSAVQVAALPSAAFPGFTPAQIGYLPENALTGLSVDDTSQIAPASCATFTGAQLAAVPSAAFEGFNPLQTAYMIPSALAGLSAEDISFIQPFSFGIWTAGQLAALAPAACTGINKEQMWTVQNSSCSGFTPACLANIPVASQQGDCFPIAGPQWTLQSYSQAVMMGIFMESDRKTGYISGGDNGVGATVVQTIDGGQTWNQVPIHQPALMFTSLAGSDQPFGVVANGIGLVGFGGTQYAVANGAKFTNSSEVYEQYGAVDYQQSQDVQPVQGAPGAFGVVGVFGFWKMNASEHLNMLALSDDNGATFQFISLQESLSDQTVHLRYCSFPSPSVGFIAAGKWPSMNRVQTLPDGSEVRQLSRFVELHTHAETKHVSLRAARRTQHKSANGNGNVAIIQRSTDGFQTWQQVYFNDTFYPNAISCPSENVCFAAAENDDYGYILGTSDGGDTWQILETAWFTSMFAARALSETEVFIGGGILSSAGIIGTVWHSTDGGQTFVRQQVDGQYFLNMQFFGSESAVAVASDASGNGSLLFFGSSE